MKAINWLRSRQEENELGYWLSFVAYDQSDRSLVNKAYLLYLVIFMFFWIMMVLFFFAKYGGMALAFLNPDQATGTALIIEWVVLAGWNLFFMIQSSRRSPIVFSETDKSLICQTPVSRRVLVLRWLWMPWFKSALLFWFLALVLGFSAAELHFTGGNSASAIFSYMGFGLRALIQIFPVHLAMFAIQWIVGVFRLQKNEQKNWVILPAIAIGLLTLGMVFFDTVLSRSLGISVLRLFMTPEFIDGTGSSPLIMGIASAVLFLVVLFFTSRQFNLNRAAQETSDVELLTSAAKYGFTDLADQKRLQNSLSNKRKVALNTRHKGDSSIIWKNEIQSLRGFSWKQSFSMLSVFGILLGLPLLPGFVSKILILFFLVNQVGPLLTQRLRSDLACWPILQQLPIRKPKILILDLYSNWFIFMLIGIVAFGVSTLFTKTLSVNFILLLPGLLATIGLTAAIDIFRKSKSDLLINGNVPSVGTQGVILGLIGTIIPIGLATIFNSLGGLILSILIGLAITWIYYKFAVYAFKNIKS